MSKSVNRVILVGHLGADPELRSTATGQKVCDFRIATNTYRVQPGGATEETPEWHRIVVWERLAENCAEYLRKGRLVYVEGRMQTRRYQDREGISRSTTEVVAQQVIFLSSREPAPAELDAPEPGPAAVADPTRAW